jgi:hypothetical protein
MRPRTRTAGHGLGRRRSRLTPIGLALVAVAAGSCDTGPSAGDIVFNLTTPNQDDGAVQFRITSVAPAAIAAVSAECGGCQVFTAALGDTEMRGVLLGDVVAGAALRVTVSDRKAEGYVATVVAVSDRQYALRSVIGYTLAQ